MIVMNTIWLKIVSVLVLLVVIFVIFNKIKQYTSKPEEPVKTIADTWRNDDKRLRAEPNLAEPNVAAPKAAESNVPAQPEAGQPAVAEQTPAAEPRKFRELTEDEKAGAEQLFELAIQHRKMGRLPGAIGIGKMVQYCREIIERYPGSEYAYKAKRMLGDIPEREREFFHVTKDELDLSK
jgi:TolA-binding protein